MLVNKSVPFFWGPPFLVRTVRIRDDARGHDFGVGNPQNRGSHFNDEIGNHYDY
ncbi:HNH/endonuclease VII fold putative polymorphic toxin [Pseudomonas sp. NFACC43]|uniref:HNH/endonuclease VII fold putative polymorphic toxin n=1 Tax=unclassified Pseudomonas TaxID=196821 RepID=UPI003527B272